MVFREVCQSQLRQALLRAKEGWSPRVPHIFFLTSFSFSWACLELLCSGGHVSPGIVRGTGCGDAYGPCESEGGLYHACGAASRHFLNQAAGVGPRAEQTLQMETRKAQEEGLKGCGV